MHSLRQDLHEAEERLLTELRELRRGIRKGAARDKPSQNLTVGQRVADQVAATMGSWPFIIVQSLILLVWIVLNITAYVQRWDPYPFILLNLALSFQAAYAFIMMSQNRQQDIDRKEAENDHQINIKAELEIELLHQKIDQLREKEVMMLTQAVSDLTALLMKDPELKT